MALDAASPGRVRVVGPGRAGGALAVALAAIGWSVAEPVRRGGDVRQVALDVDLVVIATPDAAIADVAVAMEPWPDVVVAHLAGSLGLEVLAPHARRAALHPLASLPSATVGAERLASGAWFAVAGSDAHAQALVEGIVAGLGGTSFMVADGDRASYHAAACIASNHLVALLGQVERVAGAVGVPLAAYLDLVRCSVDNVDALGPAAALTGPAARGDEATLDRHRAALAALDPFEIEAYDAMVAQISRLLGR